MESTISFSVWNVFTPAFCGDFWSSVSPKTSKHETVKCVGLRQHFIGYKCVTTHLSWRWVCPESATHHESTDSTNLLASPAFACRSYFIGTPQTGLIIALILGGPWTNARLLSCFVPMRQCQCLWGLNGAVNWPRVAWTQGFGLMIGVSVKRLNPFFLTAI